MQRLIISNTTVFAGSDFHRLDNTDILIEGGRIAAIGRNLSNGAGEKLDGSEFFVTPGFINSHFHPAQQPNRALGVGLGHDQQMDLLHATDSIKKPGDRIWMSQLALVEGLHAGTTAFYSVGSEIETQIEVFNKIGLRAACTLLPKDISDDEKHASVKAKKWETRERLQKAEDLHRQHHSNLVRVHFGACNVKYASDELICGMLSLAEKYNTSFHMHAAEGDAYVQAVVKRTGQRSIEHLHALQALNARVSLAHVTSITQNEIQMLASTGTTVVHCPRSNAYVAAGNCPVTDLFEAGVNIALGSDAAINNNSNEVRGEARVVSDNAARHQFKAGYFRCGDLFRMLTLNGARAMGLESLTGSLEPGKAADLVLWSKNEIPFIPGHDYLADLIFNDSCRAHTVFVDGKMVLKDHIPQLVDQSEIIARCREISERYHKRFRELSLPFSMD